MKYFKYTFSMVAVLLIGSFLLGQAEASQPGSPKKGIKGLVSRLGAKAGGAAMGKAQELAGQAGEKAVEAGKAQAIKAAKKVHYTTEQKILQLFYRTINQITEAEGPQAARDRICKQGKVGAAGCNPLQLVKSPDEVTPRSCQGIIFKVYPKLIEPYVTYCQSYVGPGSKGEVSTIFDSGAAKYFPANQFQAERREAEDMKEYKLRDNIQQMLEHTMRTANVENLEALKRSVRESLNLGKVPLDEEAILDPGSDSE